MHVHTLQHAHEHTHTCTRTYSETRAISCCVNWCSNLFSLPKGWDKQWKTEHHFVRLSSTLNWPYIIRCAQYRSGPGSQGPMPAIITMASYTDALHFAGCMQAARSKLFVPVLLLCYQCYPSVPLRYHLRAAAIVHLRLFIYISVNIMLSPMRW